MPYYKDFQLRTDTASIAVFDDDVIAHRIEDYSDWWTTPGAQLEEINAGTMVLVSLGADGFYKVHVQVDGPLDEPALRARILSRSGEVRIAPGEALPGEEIMPEGGLLLDREPGVYEVAMRRVGDMAVAVSVTPVEGEAVNSFGKPLDIDSTG